MRRFTLGEIVVASALVGSASSAATCIIPHGVLQAQLDWESHRTPETEEAWRREAGRWPVREHAALAATLSAAGIAFLGCLNLLLPKRAAFPGQKDGD